MQENELHMVIEELTLRIRLGIPSLSIDFIKVQGITKEEIPAILQGVMEEVGKLWQNNTLALTQVIVPPQPLLSQGCSRYCCKSVV